VPGSTAASAASRSRAWRGAPAGVLIFRRLEQHKRTIECRVRCARATTTCTSPIRWCRCPACGCKPSPRLGWCSSSRRAAPLSCHRCAADRACGEIADGSAGHRHGVTSTSRRPVAEMTTVLPPRSDGPVASNDQKRLIERGYGCHPARHRLGLLSSSAATPAAARPHRADGARRVDLRRLSQSGGRPQSTEPEGIGRLRPRTPRSARVTRECGARRTRAQSPPSPLYADDRDRSIFRQPRRFEIFFPAKIAKAVGSGRSHCRRLRPSLSRMARAARRSTARWSTRHPRSPERSAGGDPTSQRAR
jgi:hypothetical protein